MIMLFLRFLLFLPFFPIIFLHKDLGTKANVTFKWEVQESSTLGIEGQSNINKFRCDIEKYHQPDTIICYGDAVTSNPVKLKGSLKIDLFTFNCHSRLITNDMRKTLKADEYPKLVIHFISLDRAPVLNSDTDNVKGLVNIELAGVTKNFEILYSFTKQGSSSILLNGGRTFNFSDFNLKPPKKLGGIIQIKDEFSVNFKLMLIPF